MSNFSTFFPSGGGSGGGGGILKQHRITTSGTLDLTTLGIADGDTIGLMVVGSGSGGYTYSSTNRGGSGGGVWKGTVTIGTAGTVTATIPAGGNGNANGAAAVLSGGGLPFNINTGISSTQGLANSQPNITPGTVYNGMAGYYNSSQDVSNAPGSGIDGYGIGGTATPGYQVNVFYGTAYANSGRGGCATTASQAVGASGVIIIFYS